MCRIQRETTKKKIKFYLKNNKPHKKTFDATNLYSLLPQRNARAVISLKIPFMCTIFDKFHRKPL